ncbi:hypothetical protein K432DRAFT_422700 [Lepidopterella palustris CBS 459.81]|uniref:DUF7730 domain-containing protein n=1 Tax=Lepidopterella palustris CBS 459.81 TaxID=1314670 RepID=A0A8E2JJ10_9PEZI|nr:hypothetical protein K432DRAFT_422700 [Lepidopterella palustris CBS 459.81]
MAIITAFSPFPEWLRQAKAKLKSKFSTKQPEKPLPKLPSAANKPSDRGTRRASAHATLQTPIIAAGLSSMYCSSSRIPNSVSTPNLHKTGLKRAATGPSQLRLQMKQTYDVPNHRMNEQVQSALFTNIPAEIRLMIHELVVGPNNSNDSVRLLAIPRRYSNTSTWFTTFKFEEFKREWLYGAHNSHVRMRSNVTHDKQHVLDWLLSCQKIYDEAIDFLYALNRFEFAVERDFCLFSARRCQMNPSWLSQIRSVCIMTECPGLFPGDRKTTHTLRHAVRTIANMDQIVRLRLSVMTNPWDIDIDRVLDHLEPLTALKVKDFKIGLRYPVRTEEVRWYFGGDMPFQFVAVEGLGLERFCY